MTLSFEEALSIVREKLSGGGAAAGAEVVPLNEARGRVLAADAAADRDYPPFHRSTRDGYAVRAADTAGLPAGLDCRGEVRAGEHFEGEVGPGQCVSIMTGAPLPAGADAVLMLEHARRDGNRVQPARNVEAFENVVRRGSEAAAGNRVLPRGRRLGPGEMGLLATLGQARVEVFRRPRVAVIPTGDEIVPLDRQPEWFQIRNSNAVTLSAQVAAAGGIPWNLDIAPDRAEPLRKLIKAGLNADLLLLSGGVSMGKYDLVEQVLEGLGAEFFIQSVAIRPGKPLVFGRAGERFFFGLPGNPVSTFVTFELFVRPAIALLGGAEFEPPVFLRARLGKPLRQRLGLTAFMPARAGVRDGEPEVNLVGYQGSGDLVGMAAANCFLVVRPEQTDLAAGDWVDVLPKPA